MILPTIISPKCQCDAERYHLFMIFAVFDPLLFTLWINCCFYIRQVNGVNGEIYCDAFFLLSVRLSVCEHSVFRCKYLENGLR